MCNSILGLVLTTKQLIDFLPLVCLCRRQATIAQWKEFEQNARSLESWIPAALSSANQVMAAGTSAGSETAEQLAKKLATIMVSICLLWSWFEAKQ